MKYTKVKYSDYLELLESQVRKVEERDNIDGLWLEIIESLDDGLAHLFMGDHCAAVLRPSVEDGELVVYVIFGWSLTGSGINDYIDVYEKLAREINAKRIITKTARKGVVRLWERHGFESKGIDYDGLVKVEKVLNYG